MLEMEKNEILFCDDFSGILSDEALKPFREELEIFSYLKQEDIAEEEFNSAIANTNVFINDTLVLNDTLWSHRRSFSESDSEMNMLVNPNDVMPSLPCFDQVKLGNGCGIDDFEMEHEIISIEHEIKTSIKQEVQSIESNILTPPRTPDNSECLKTEIFPKNYLDQAQPKQSGMTPPLSPEGTDIARCLEEFLEGADLNEFTCKVESFEEEEDDDDEEEEDDDDDDNDVDEEEEIIAEKRIQQLYRMQEESNSCEEWMKSREKSIARPINATENDHSYYKGLHSEETAYEYYCTPSESEDSEVDVVSLPNRQQQIREQQYLMQLQQQALPQQEEKPQRRLPQRRKRGQQQSTQAAKVQPVRQVRKRGRKPAAKGKSSMPEKVSAAPKKVSAAPKKVSAASKKVSAAPKKVSAALEEVFDAPEEVSDAESLDNLSEVELINTEGEVIQAGTKRKAVNKSGGPATKRRRGRVGNRDMMPAEKREKHNELERERRNELKAYSDLLRIHVPEIAHLEKASRARILNASLKYINELKALRKNLKEIKAAERRRASKLLTKRLQLEYERKKHLICPVAYQ